MNSYRRWGMAALVLFPLAAPAAQPLGCLIEPFRVSEVGSQVIGVIESTLVERGDRVTVGQALATLRSDVERQSVAVALSKAQAVGELQAAEANALLARQKLARAQDLANQEFISSQALEQARAEAAVAEHRLAQVREQRGVYMREHEMAQAQLGLRTIRSPIAGVVVDRYLSTGERVEEKPVYRVAMVNPLRVEVVLPSSFYATVRLNMPVTITPDFPGATARTAKVTLVDKVIDGASNTFRIRLELPNPDLSLPAGLRCKADLGVSPGAAPQRSAAPQPAAVLPSSLRLVGSPAPVPQPAFKH
ncbi:efflux RND transporter periplasmic adaptor subunit [Ramlibacter sp. PS3R-8]|uniref:efflux RND transporter periplasmic adaptor subunit n=1 Tax=Ramlibacter sp. PS3R-8 TaxID=3133437 RepID=UPI00309CD8FB